MLLCMYLGEHSRRQGPDQAELGHVGREGEGRERENQVQQSRGQGYKRAGNQMVRLYMGWRVQGREQYRRTL